MKKLLLLGICSFLTFVSFSQNSQKAVEYMNVISGEFKAIQNATWDYTRSVAKNKSARKVDKNRVELLQTISVALGKVKKIGAYEGKTYFRDSTIAFLEMNKSVVSQDYEKIMNMEEIAEQSYDLMEAYMKAQEVASDRLSEAGDRISEVEKKFAAENNINLIESSDKVSNKLKKAGEMYEYYNPVYLIFFKSYKQELYFMDALQKGDVSAMEQNKSMLSKTAQEGLALIKAVSAFKGDETLKKACADMLTFYQEEAEKKFQVFIDFQSTKESFDKAKKTMESKKEKDRTQEDVNNYNALVKEYNKATGDYNNMNTELNNKRSKLIDNWNNMSGAFTNRHI